MAESRIYSIAGHGVRVVLEQPWTFTVLSPAQQALVARLAAGEDLGVESVPADHQEQLALNDAIMGREQMTRERWKEMDGEARRKWHFSLDFLQYEPFRVIEPDADVLFSLTVHDGQMDKTRRGSWELVINVDDIVPYFRGYTFGDNTIYEFFIAEDTPAGTLVIDGGARQGHYYPEPGVDPRVTMLQLNTALMLQFTHATAPLDTVLLHASAMRYKGKANLFFGVSGTGKSTHSRLWSRNIPGCDLLNDDNPIIRIIPGQGAVVYGGPWSGKTLCYRNVQAPVGALVRLEQAPSNQIERISGLQAYASILAAISSVRWDSRIMDSLMSTVEKLAMEVPCYRLRCLPDREAALLCKNTVEQ